MTDYIQKKVLNKSCSDFSFLQKTQWAHMSIFPRSGAMGLERLPCSKYDNVRKCENRLTLWLNAAKSTIWKKVPNKDCWDFNFQKKFSWRTRLSQSEASLAWQIVVFEIYNVRKRENRLTLQLNTDEVHNFSSKKLRTTYWYNIHEMISAFVDNSVAQKLLFETFLHIICIFGSVQLQHHSYFPISVHYCISNMTIFGTP